MRYIIQFFWIFFFYFLGLGLSYILNGYIPGSVLGMLLLFGSLSLGWIKPNMVSGAANFFIKYMVLFFIPAAIGIITSWGHVEAQLWAVITAIVFSTIAVISAVGLTQQILEKKFKK